MTTTSRRLLALPIAASISAVLVAGIGSPASAAPSATGTAGARPAAAKAVTVAAVAAKIKVPFAGQSARSVKNKAAAALRTAKSFRVAGREGSSSLNVFVSAAGGYGDVSDVKGTIHVLRIGKALYFMPDAKMRTKLNIPDSMADKWLRVPATSSSYKDMADVVTPAHWASWLGQANVTYRRTGQKVRGLPTVQLWQPGPKGGSIFVAAKGPAYPLWVYRTNKTLNVQFVDFNKPFTAKPPAPGTIVNLPS